MQKNWQSFYTRLSDPFSIVDVLQRLLSSFALLRYPLCNMVLAIPTLPNQRSLAAQSCETERSIELGPVLCLCFARPAKRRHWDSCRHRRQNTLPWLVTIQTHSTTTFFSGMPMVEQTSFTHLSNLVSISQSLIILPHVRMYTRQVEPIWGWSGRSSHSVETQFERTPGELFAHAVSQESVGRLDWFHGGLAANKFTSYTCIHHFTWKCVTAKVQMLMKVPGQG